MHKQSTTCSSKENMLANGGLFCGPTKLRFKKSSIFLFGQYITECMKFYTERSVIVVVRVPS